MQRFNFSMREGILAFSALVAMSASAQFLEDDQYSAITGVPERVIVLQGDSANVDGEMVAVVYDTKNLHFQDPRAPRFLFVDRKGNTALGIGGYVEGVAQYDFNGAVDGSGFTTFNIPVPKNPALSTRLGADATRSTLFLQLVRRTNFGMLTGYIQTDFSGNNGGYGVTVKQAYIRLGGLTFGLTNSTFADPAAAPPTIDYQGHPGAIGAKNLILQYRRHILPNLEVALSFENPKATYTTEEGKCEAINQRFPDIPAFVQYDFANNSHVRLSGIFRDLSYRDLVSGKNRFEPGWGVQLSGVVSPVRDFTIYGQCGYGKGIGHYVNDLAGFGYDLIHAGNGTMTAPKDLAIVAGVRYDFSKKFFMSTSYSLNRTYGDSALGETAYQRGNYMILNGFYTFGDGFQVGAEYLFGMRHNINGQHGLANRVEAMIKYSF